jgi:hypothetical protein
LAELRPHQDDQDHLGQRPHFQEWLGLESVRWGENHCWAYAVHCGWDAYEVGPNNILERGQVGLLRDVFGMDIQLTIQRTRQVLNFCAICSNREMIIPPAIDYGVLNQVWIVTNQTLGLLVMPLDWLVNPNNQMYPFCPKPILSWAFGVPACGHLMHTRC